MTSFQVDKYLYLCFKRTVENIIIVLFALDFKRKIMDIEVALVP